MAITSQKSDFILEKYTLLQNILLGLSLAAPIGPVNVEIIKRGLNSGFKQAFLTGAGAMCADATYLILIFFGLTSFLNFDFMKIFLGIAGSIILIYLGAISAREFFGRPIRRKCQAKTIIQTLICDRLCTGHFQPHDDCLVDRCLRCASRLTDTQSDKYFRFFLLPLYFTGLLSLGVFSGLRTALGEENHYRKNNRLYFSFCRKLSCRVRHLFSLSGHRIDYGLNTDLKP